MLTSSIKFSASANRLTLLVTLAQMLRRQRAPVLFEWIRCWFPLNCRNGLFYFPNSLGPPSRDHIKGCPIPALHFLLGNLQTIPADRRRFQLGRNVTRVIVFAVAAKTKQ